MVIYPNLKTSNLHEIPIFDNFFVVLCSFRMTFYTFYLYVNRNQMFYSFLNNNAFFKRSCYDKLLKTLSGYLPKFRLLSVNSKLDYYFFDIDM